MNAGFVSKKREEQLWEVQRIITQLKRKLKSFDKKQEKSIEELEVSCTSLGNDTTDSVTKTIQTITTENEAKITAVLETIDQNRSAVPAEIDLKQTTQDFINDARVGDDTNTTIAVTPPCPNEFIHPDGLYIDEDTGLLMVPQNHPDYSTLLRLQLENQELLAWKNQLQARISSERAEILRLKQMQQQMSLKMSQKAVNNIQSTMPAPPPENDYERIVEHFLRENALLEHKKQMLSKEIFEEHKQCIAFQVELAMQKY